MIETQNNKKRGLILKENKKKLKDQNVLLHSS